MFKTSLENASTHIVYKRNSKRHTQDHFPPIKKWDYLRYGSALSSRNSKIYWYTGWDQSPMCYEKCTNIAFIFNFSRYH